MKFWHGAIRFSFQFFEYGVWCKAFARYARTARAHSMMIASGVASVCMGCPAIHCRRFLSPRQTLGLLMKTFLIAAAAVLGATAAQAADTAARCTKAPPLPRL
jgi:hypothetical protein